MKRCADVYRHICDNLDQKLDSPECRAIKKHLEGCPDCQAYLASLKQTIRLYRTLPSPRVPEGLHIKLDRALTAARKTRTTSRTSQRARSQKR